jgi:hypothetical protein
MYITLQSYLDMEKDNIFPHAVRKFMKKYIQLPDPPKILRRLLIIHTFM